MNIQISISIEGEEYGVRYWHIVPRKGEYIKLLGKQEGWYLIKCVEWSGDEYPIVNLVVEKEI